VTPVLADAAADHLSAARAATSGRPLGRWGSRIATATAVYHLGQQGRQAWRNWQAAHRSYTVTVPEGDEVYDLVHEWLLARLPDDARRALLARTITDQASTFGLEIPGGGADLKRRVVLTYDGDRSHDVEIDGHTVNVLVTRDEQSSKPGRDEDGRSSYFVAPRRVVFTARSPAGRDAVAGFLQSIAESLTIERPARLILASKWGNWSTRRNLPHRPLDSVVLPAGHLDDLVADLRRFLGAEAAYERLGQPWHRGYLLSGPPGTGKTSAFRALASHFRLDVYSVSLSDLGSDANLMELLANVPERVMLLLEDIDVVHAAKTRDDADRPGLTLAGLLNALDGMATPHGLVTAMTTNDRSVLDPALLRPGRVDKERTTDYLTPAQFTELVRSLTGHRVELQESGTDLLASGRVQVSAAEVVGAIIEHHDDPAAGRAAAASLWTDRWAAAIDTVTP